MGKTFQCVAREVERSPFRVDTWVGVAAKGGSLEQGSWNKLDATATNLCGLRIIGRWSVSRSVGQSVSRSVGQSFTKDHRVRLEV